MRPEHIKIDFSTLLSIKLTYYIDVAYMEKLINLYDINTIGDITNIINTTSLASMVTTLASDMSTDSNILESIIVGAVNQKLLDHNINDVLEDTYVVGVAEYVNAVTPPLRYYLSRFETHHMNILSMRLTDKLAYIIVERYEYE